VSPHQANPTVSWETEGRITAPQSRLSPLLTWITVSMCRLRVAARLLLRRATACRWPAGPVCS